MPSLRSLLLVAALAVAPNSGYARPTTSGPGSLAARSTVSGIEPASLLGRHYLVHNEKRAPVILMAPALEDGMRNQPMRDRPIAPKPMPPKPMPPKRISGKQKSISPRTVPMPLIQHLAERSAHDAQLSRREEDIHPENYLSKVEPPSSPSVQTPSIPSPDSSPLAMTGKSYKPYGPPQHKQKTKEQHHNKSSEGKSKSKKKGHESS
ncbi:hypothetical protein K474DRAFT_1339316 [Panus rudis PR-1116 ss-1]|nr:hypothetical protein K474DRAFT_1339316 [Panus rudis PR-1116 ss-1]